MFIVGEKVKLKQAKKRLYGYLLEQYKELGYIILEKIDEDQQVATLGYNEGEYINFPIEFIEHIIHHKYIYHLQVDKYNIVHCEKYPVVYENSIYVYYKTGRKSSLNYVEKEYINNNFNEILEKKYLRSGYLFERPTKEELKIQSKRLEVMAKKKEIEKKRSDLNYMQKKRIETQKYIEDLEKDILKLEEEIKNEENIKED